MNAIVEPPQAVVRTNPHHTEIHRRPRVHETRGLGETLWELGWSRYRGGTHWIMIQGSTGWRSRSTAWTRRVLHTFWGGGLRRIWRGPFSLRTWGLPTFRDLPPARVLYIEESWLTSWGTLHRSSRIKYTCE
jgi:hypothetical protein